MTLAQMRQAVKLSKKHSGKKKILLEASGGVTLKKVEDIAKTGVDRISIGALTCQRKGIDFSMELIEE
jgi:nicotinate-nucleotide pyrophosphorylase (carboxylating)